MMIEIHDREAAIANCVELAKLVDRHTAVKGNGAHSTAIDFLEFTRECEPASAILEIYKPLLGIVVQGKKEVSLNEETYRYGVAQYLVLSVDLPVSACVVAATPDRPYLGFKLNLDPVQLCDIIAQINIGIGKKESVRGCFISDAEPSLIDCAIRLTRLLDTPQDIPFLAPTILREIYYRLLLGEQGEAVRQIATAGSNMQRIAEVIKQVNVDFAKPLRVEELAPLGFSIGQKLQGCFCNLYTHTIAAPFSVNSCIELTINRFTSSILNVLCRNPFALLADSVTITNLFENRIFVSLKRVCKLYLEPSTINSKRTTRDIGSIIGNEK
jgi:AraC-type transcriptional regulator N-terminus